MIASILINTLEGHLSLALLYDAREQVETQDIASLPDTVATLDDLASRFDASEFDDIIVEMLKMRVDLRKGHLDAVRRWIFGRGLDGAPDRKPAYYGDGSMASRIYKYELPILARWHIAEARYQEALDVLQELARLAEQAGRPHLLVESYILQARVFYRQGDGESALKVLKKALDIAGPQRSCRIFLVEGNDIIQLLKAGKREWDAAEIGDFVDSLLLASTGLVAGARDVIGGSDMLVEALSPRELEVLHLLPSGLTAVELADELLISVNTLRSHMKNIYAKLGVHSRHEAVVKATQLGLL